MPRNGATIKTKSLEVSAPSGAVSAFAGTTAPTGWLLCDGSAVSRTTYSVLFAAIGTSCGSGDGSTTFNLPDYRGRFLRGVDGVAGNDPDKTARTAMNSGGATGNSVGSVQGDQYKSHNHIYYSGGTASPGGYGYGDSNVNNLGDNNDAIAYSGGNETRPKNAGVNYIIKI